MMKNICFVVFVSLVFWGCSTKNSPTASATDSSFEFQLGEPDPDVSAFVGESEINLGDSTTIDLNALHVKSVTTPFGVVVADEMGMVDTFWVVLPQVTTNYSFVGDPSGRDQVTIRVIQPEVDSTNTNPQVLTLKSSVGSGPAPLQVVFEFDLHDEDGDSIRYILNFGDGNSVSGKTAAQAGVEVDHLFTESGKLHNVELLITDDRNGFGRGSTTVQTDPVTGNSNPVIGSINPSVSWGYAPLHLTIEVNAFDPDGDTLTYDWDFNDGSTQSGMELYFVDHTFTESGTYNVSVLLKDGKGGFNSTNTTIQVDPQQTTTGKVDVRSKPPNAAIFVDGDSESLTPNEITLSPGSHRVEIVLAGHESFDQFITVYADSTIELFVELTPIIPAPVLSVAGQPQTIDSGQSANLIFTVQNLSGIMIQPDNVTLSGTAASYSVSPTETTLYTATGAGLDGTSVQDTVTIFVRQVPVDTTVVVAWDTTGINGWLVHKNRLRDERRLSWPEIENSYVDLDILQSGLRQKGENAAFELEYESYILQFGIYDRNGGSSEDRFWVRLQVPVDIFRDQKVALLYAGNSTDSSHLKGLRVSNDPDYFGSAPVANIVLVRITTPSGQVLQKGSAQFNRESKALGFTK